LAAEVSPKLAALNSAGTSFAGAVVVAVAVAAGRSPLPPPHPTASALEPRAATRAIETLSFVQEVLKDVTSRSAAEPLGDCNECEESRDADRQEHDAARIGSRVDRHLPDGRHRS
jgi:hypothetical protein